MFELKPGDVVGKWTVTRKQSPKPRGFNGKHVRCRCECGTVSWIDRGSLKIGQSRSCGCVTFPCEGKKVDA